MLATSLPQRPSRSYEKGTWRTRDPLFKTFVILCKTSLTSIPRQYNSLYLPQPTRQLRRAVTSMSFSYLTALPTLFQKVQMMTDMDINRTAAKCIGVPRWFLCFAELLVLPDILPFSFIGYYFPVNVYTRGVIFASLLGQLRVLLGRSMMPSVKSRLSPRRELVLELRGVTCHNGITHACHPTQVNAPRLNPSNAVSRYSIYLPRRDGRLSRPRLPGNAPAGSRTRDLSITSPTP